MPPAASILLNTPHIELWPGGLLHARRSHDARLLAHATWVLRRKRDGRYLAVLTPDGPRPLVHRAMPEPGLQQALHLAAAGPHLCTGMPRALPLQDVARRLAALDIDANQYAQRTGLALVPEPDRLSLAGRDRFGRVLWLQADAARAWQRMRRAAARDGITLDAISGYRSHDYQWGIVARKQARGQDVTTILRVNAAPGFSEHHGGRALDIGTPGNPPAEESFELTPAFAWLQRHGMAHGFRLSYPRNNPHGIVYEPWHWCHVGAAPRG